MRQLSEPLILHSVNLELACEQAERRFLRRTGATLNFQDAADLRAHMLGEAWKLAAGFDASRDARGRAGCVTYLDRLLAGRVVDWMRGRAGDARYPNLLERKRSISQALSLDAPVGNGARADDDSRNDPLGAIVPDRGGDLADGRSAACGGHLSRGDSSESRDRALIRSRVTRLARERAEAARERAYERALSRRTG